MTSVAFCHSSLLVPRNTRDLPNSKFTLPHIPQGRHLQEIYLFISFFSFSKWILPT